MIKQAAKKSGGLPRAMGIDWVGGHAWSCPSEATTPLHMEKARSSALQDVETDIIYMQ